MDRMISAEQLLEWRGFAEGMKQGTCKYKNFGWGPILNLLDYIAELEKRLEVKHEANQETDRPPAG